MQEALKLRIDRLDRRPLQFQQASRRGANVELLLLNSSLGTLSVEALKAAALVFAQRKGKPCPSFHVTAVESSLALHEFARLLPRKTCGESSAIVEDLLLAAEPKALVWNSFGNTTAPATSTAPATATAPATVTVPATSPVSATASVPVTAPAPAPATDGERSTILEAKTVGNSPLPESQLSGSSSHAKGGSPAVSPVPSEAVLSKLKSRLRTLAKDPRQLRPAIEDGKSKLALAKLIHAQMKPDGPDLPPAKPDDYLHDKADVVVHQMIDSGLLGEGILPILAYCRDALTKTSGKVCQCRAHTQPYTHTYT